GGYYDRTLAALQASGQAFVSVGIAWASGDLSQMGHQPQTHDIRLDAVLTDKGWALKAPEP
ncbi:MAG: 5-formyltetrahydrofolate cyclo-ligase, partial [Castellaniella sp.]